MAERTLLAAQLSRVHRLAKNLDCHTTSLLQSAILFIVLLEETLRACIVGTCTCGLPATVVAGRVAKVELELSSRIPASIDEGHTERT